MKRFLIPLGIFLALAIFLGVGLKLNPREVPSPLIDKPAPDFALASLASPDKIVRKQDMLGKVWLFNVWASWCVSCRAEHPVLIDYAQRKQVPLIGLNYKDERNDGLRWLQQGGNPYDDSVYDIEGRTGIDYGVYGVPETFVIDKQGVIRYKHIGPLTPEVLQSTIEPLLRKLNG
jgi:cytochrome c biogenesis protein CcmG/thiol:disulfide interchange protein DsbE